MSNLQLSTPVYIAGAIMGAVMILTSIVVLFVRPADVAQMAQNNAMHAVVVVTPTPELFKFYTGADGGWYWVTATPAVVSDYVVVIK